MYIPLCSVNMFEPNTFESLGTRGLDRLCLIELPASPVKPPELLELRSFTCWAPICLNYFTFNCTTISQFSLYFCFASYFIATNSRSLIFLCVTKRPSDEQPSNFFYFLKTNCVFGMVNGCSQKLISPMPIQCLHALQDRLRASDYSS